MKRMICVALASVACMATACSTATSYLTEEQGDVIAEYAADLLLSYDKNYEYKYVEAEPTTEEETFGEEIEFSTEGDTTSSTNNEKGEDEKDTTVQVEETTTEKVMKTIDEILGINGIEVKVKDFSLVDSYPDEQGKDAFFIMKATKGTKLLIVKLNVKNVSERDIELNIMECNAKYRAYINGTDKLVAQITLLLDAFNTYEGTIKAGKTEEMVLVFQTGVKSKSAIKNFELDVFCGENQGTITLK